MESGVPVHAVRDRFPGDPRTVMALARLARRPDVHVLQTHGYKANVFGLVVAKACRRPWVAFLHGETWENPKVRAYYALERLAVRRADRVVVVSRAMAGKVAAQGIPFEKIRVVHNACLVDWRGEARARGARTLPVVGVIGRLSPEKGVDRALQVHRAVTQKVADARLLIAGEGPEGARLQRYAEELGVGGSVRWLGYRESLGEVYRQLTVLLIPSRSEGLPNVALEAMAYGVPVVASSVGGLAEVISEGEDGFLLPPDDTTGLARRVLEILQDPSLRERLGRRAVEAVGARFSLEARTRAMTGIYEEVRR
jgi:glycosyltransferase involved in cell wall biosynthesis